MISHLLLKPAHKRPMVPVERFAVTAAQGIAGNIRCPPLRQVLLLEEQTLQQFGLRPGDLRENIIVRDLDLYHLPSGSVLQIGNVKIALTFLCEPCKIIADKVNLKAIAAQRGMLGRLLNDGEIAVGDAVTVTSERLETISSLPRERIQWYLNKITGPITASELMWQVGLASSYCRALPAMLKKHPEMDKSKIIFQRQQL